MSPVKVRSLVAIVAFTFAALACRATEACSCDQPPPPAERAAAVAAVFEGYVLDTTLDSQGTTRTVHYQVLRAWKGVHADTVVMVTTGSDGASCGIDAEVHTSYLIYATLFEGRLTAGLCFLSHRSDQDAGDFAALGAPAEVGTAAPGSLGASVPAASNAGCAVGNAGSSGACVGFLAALALLVLTTRRRGPSAR
jgi:MYXO-CTERM domain-containing protein